MRKTLTVRAEEDRAESPGVPIKARARPIAESRLDTLHDTAREMRRNPTEAETVLAEGLVRAELGKYRFKRQAVLGSAIVDFACLPLRVVVEIDDETNGDPALARRHDKALEADGMTVLRFPAAAVLADTDAVVATIVAAMKSRWQERRVRPTSGASRDRTATARRGNQR